MRRSRAVSATGTASVVPGATSASHAAAANDAASGKLFPVKGRG
jgi:hypothetical protein